MQLDNIVHINPAGHTSPVMQYNRFVSATVSAGLAPGKSLGQGIAEIKELSHRFLMIILILL